MKTYLLTLIFISLCAGCAKSNQINGHTLHTANKSVKFIKEHLPEDLKLEFELSYWTLRDEFKDNAAFLKTIDGKDAFGLINLGQASFARRKTAGFKEYSAYADWQAMLLDYTQKRSTQSKPSVNADKDANYKRSVIYHPRFKTQS